MAYQLRFLQEVEEEFDEAIVWYETKKIGLGEMFALEVDGFLKTTRSDSYRFPKASKKGIRKCVLKRFPFVVYFTVKESESQIIIVSIFHTSRSPKIWKKRV